MKNVGTRALALLSVGIGSGSLREQDEVQRARVRQRLSGIEGENQKLADAIATGAPGAPLVAAIQTRDEERRRLQGELAALDAVPGLTNRDRDELRGQLGALMADWRGLLLAHTNDARQIVRKLLADKVRFTPEERDGVRAGEWRPKARFDR